ncbi:unnamed protein product [Caenorhabditis auriculariae]|uniref:Peptidase M14 domain-containing protein n=1 Tax=Caenorhabditis auriculariae TaxID=2777116 RepID=A0A8S1HAA6_9PELO|nr:unnamed protein product [Caenorhabditis auriculariae]
MNGYGFLLVYLTSSIFSAVAYKSYDGYRVVSVTLPDETAKRQVRDLTNQLGYQPDLLGESHKANHSAHFIIPGKDLGKVKAHFDKNHLQYSVKDINPEIFKQRRRRNALDGDITLADLDNRYLSYEEQMRFLETLAQQFPNRVKLIDIGNTYEGRSLRSVRIGDDGRPKPIVWIDSGTHAREWISYNAALFLIYTLATNPAYQNVLDRVQVVVVPNTNPDGYEYSRNADRLWRKTRSRIQDIRCAGADMNRNYPFFWGTEGVSHSPCSEIFCGVRSMSEVETAALVSAIQREESRIRAYAALHSYGQEILYPWGHTVHKYPADVEDLKRVGNAMSLAIRNVNGSFYKVVNSGDGLYPAAGASDDWAKSRGIKYSFTIELAPIDDETGFALPESRIAATNRDAFAALITLVNTVDREFGRVQQRRSPSRTRHLVAGDSSVASSSSSSQKFRYRAYGRG